MKDLRNSNENKVLLYIALSEEADLSTFAKDLGPYSQNFFNQILKIFINLA